ncbi:MAG: hypothetical protein AAFV53_28555 [Myxococcota bacterium]
MTDPELLSRYLTEELSPEQVAALERRLADEPALRAHLEEMKTAIAALRDIDVIPPPALDPAVLDTPPPLQARAANNRRWLQLVAAAGVAFAIGRASVPEPAVVQIIDGDAALAFEGVYIDLEGKAEVSWEPVGWAVRKPTMSTQGDPMNLKTALTGAAAGSILAITLLEGAAWVSTDADAATQEPILLQTRHMDAPPSQTHTTTAPRKDARPSGADADLQEEVRTLRFENALLRGQMRARDGEYQPWPETFDARLRGDTILQAIQEHVGDAGEIVASDCDEYPCMTFIDYDIDAINLDREATVDGLMEAMSTGEYDGLRVPGVFIANFEAEDGDGADRLLIGVVVQTDEDLENEALQKRLNVRGGQLLEDLLER